MSDFDDDDFLGDDSSGDDQEEFEQDENEEEEEAAEGGSDGGDFDGGGGGDDDYEPINPDDYEGETIEDQLADEGWEVYNDPAIYNTLENVVPGGAEIVRFFERDGHLGAFGFVPLSLLPAVLQQFGGLDLSNLHVSVTRRGPEFERRPLPPEYRDIRVQPGVNLQQYCSSVGDQRQTARCSAFAWTHAVEMTRHMQGVESLRLSPNFTMLEFQKLQGDFNGYRNAYQGGDGTIGGPDPGQVLVQSGTCRQELWPDDVPEPATPEAQLSQDAQQHRLMAQPWPLHADDLKRVLSAGCPVHLSMNTGPAVSEVGRDGGFRAAEAPSGEHGRPALLIVGYDDKDQYLIKNSWGPKWGANGYCVIPADVLQASDPEFVAILLARWCRL